MRTAFSRVLDPRRTVLLSVMLVALVYGGTLAAIETHGLWITDNEVKLLQVRAILASDYSDFSIPWPGRDLDPAFATNPIPYMFSQVHEGQLYAVFSPVFALLSSVPYSLFGYIGLYLLPMAASLLLLLGLARLVELLVPACTRLQHAVVLAAGLGTPLWFYSVVLWEHTPAACLAIWSVIYLVRFDVGTGRPFDGNLVRMSMLAGATVYLRDEMYAFCALLVAVVAWVSCLSVPRGETVAFSERRIRAVRQTAIAAAVMIITLVPLWIFQWVATGAPLGFHLGRHLATESGFLGMLLARPRVIYGLLVSSSPSPILSILVTAPFAAAALTWWSPLRGRQGLSRALALAAAVASLVTLSGFILTEDAIEHLLASSNATFTSGPIVVLGFIAMGMVDGSDGRQSARRRVVAIIFGYALLYCLAAPDIGSRGIHWGNRYFLLLYPLLTALAAVTAERWLAGGPGVVFTLITVALVSFGAQVYSIWLLDERKDFSRHLNEVVSARSERAIVTTVRWAPQALFESFYEKAVFYADSPAEHRSLMTALEADGYREVLMITPPHPSKGVLVTDENMEFFGLTLTNYETRAFR